jgi:hypothetical protein
MKITMYKAGMTRPAQLSDVEQFKAAGWTTEPAKQEKPEEEIIRLKAPVKSKATVTAVEEANINKGDE